MSIEVISFRRINFGAKKAAKKKVAKKAPDQPVSMMDRDTLLERAKARLRKRIDAYGQKVTVTNRGSIHITDHEIFIAFNYKDPVTGTELLRAFYEPIYTRGSND